MLFNLKSLSFCALFVGVAYADEPIKMQGRHGEAWSFETPINLGDKKDSANTIVPAFLFREASLGKMDHPAEAYHGLSKSGKDYILALNSELFSVIGGQELLLMPVPAHNPGEKITDYLARFKNAICDKDRQKIKAVEHVSYTPPKVNLGTSMEAANKFQKRTLENVEKYLATDLFQQGGIGWGRDKYFNARVSEKKVALAMMGFNAESIKDLDAFFGQRRWDADFNFGSRTASFMLLAVQSPGKREIVAQLRPLAFDMALVKRATSGNAIEDSLAPIDEAWAIRSEYPQVTGTHFFAKAIVFTEIFFDLENGKRFHPASTWRYGDLEVITKFFVPSIPVGEDGKPSTAQALENRESLWSNYFSGHTKVTSAPDTKNPEKINFEVSLDLTGFCKTARPVTDLMVLE